MAEQIQLRENSTDAPVKKGNRWRVIVARPGKGSSGTYSEELFRRDAHKIVPPGGQAFINHDSTRNPKDMIGVYPEGSYWSEEDQAVVAELDVFSHWKAFVEEVGPHCGISLYAQGEADEDGNVTQIFEDRLNGADLVARAGLLGSGLAERLYESAVAGTENLPGGARQENEKKEIKMDEELREALKGITEALAVLVAEKKNAEAAEAQVKADEAAVTSAVESYAANVKAIHEADLLAPQREALLEAAKSGKDMTKDIEEAKKIKEAAFVALQESADTSAPGRISGTSASKFGAWK